MMSLSQRYARLESQPRIGAAGLAALHSKRVAVLGVGNIGGHLAQHLALLGVTLVLVDKGVVEEANLGSQGFIEEHVGLPKVDARARWLGPLNPSCRIEPLHADIRRLGLGALRDVALMFSCLDSRASRVVVNAIATRLGIPWVDGALDGSGQRLFGRVAAYDPRDAQSGCYLCPYDAEGVADIAREIRTAGCSARWWDVDDVAAPPTLAVPALGAAVASIQSIWGLNLLLGWPDAVAGRELYFDLGHGRLSTHRLTRNARCVFDHRTYSLVPLGLGVDDMTVEQTFAAAESRLNASVTLTLQHRDLVTRLRCPTCAAERQPYRIVEVIAEPDATCACGAAMEPVASDLLDRFGRAEAAGFTQRTWAEIGLPPADVVVASDGEQELHLLLSGNQAHG
jgi:adenylyltransferase/sulfurtransferase